VLDLDEQDAREVRAGPVFVELVRVLLHDPVVAVELEPRAGHALEIGIGRLRAEPVQIGGEVSVVDDKRVPSFGMPVEAFGEQHVRAQVHGPSPEFSEQPALDALVLDVAGVGGHADRRNLAIEHEGHRSGRCSTDGDPSRRAVQVAGLPVPLLALALVRRELHRMAVVPGKRLVAVEQGLCPVASGRQRLEGSEGIAERARVDRHGAARRPAVHVQAEDELRLWPVGNLKARLRRRVGGQHHQQPPIERDGALLGGKGHREARCRHARLGNGRREQERYHEEQAALAYHVVPGA
jgi:hypothetical protein